MTDHDIIYELARLYGPQTADRIDNWQSWLLIHFTVNWKWKKKHTHTSRLFIFTRDV